MVLVLDKRKRPLMPCTEKRARLLLERGRARVHKMVPFTIRLVDRLSQDSAFQPLRIKLDPGSKTTGMALVRETPDNGVAVLNLFDLVHRGKQISEALTARRALRRRRRETLRYRAPRFLNRTRPESWLSPSLQHRIDTAISWVNRLVKLVPVSGISVERVRFDTQALQNPEISGVEYQQGTLAGYEVREYLLEKWGRKCCYCGAQNVPLQIEHLSPKSQGGSNRISNLALACAACNQKKGAQDIRTFLQKQPERLARILKHSKASLRDAAAVNATRFALADALRDTGLVVESASGGRTKFNRQRFGIPKTHALDAVCVGDVDGVAGWQKPTLAIKCTGRGSYQRTRLDRNGFPRGYLLRQKRVEGFGTGDYVKAVVPKGKHQGVHVGRVAIRKTGSFNLQTPQEVLQGISHRYCQLLQRGDGYAYALMPTEDSVKKGDARQRGNKVAALSLPGLKHGVSRAIG